MRKRKTAGLDSPGPRGYEKVIPHYLDSNDEPKIERSDLYYNPKKLRPKNDWALVLNEKRKKITAGGIILPENETGVEKVSNSSGRIIRLGGGDKIKALGLKEGDRVMYRGFLKIPNQVPTKNREDEYFFIAVDDLLAVLGEEVDVSVFGGTK